MSKQIIKQPNGKYCIFSTIVDNLTDYNCTKEEIIEEFAFRFGENSRDITNKIFEKLEKGEKPYYKFTMTFDEMLKTVESIHGKDEVEELLKAINFS